MKNNEYLNKYFGGLHERMDEESYQDFMAEQKAFKEKYKDLEPAEFQKMVRIRYSDRVLSLRMKYLLHVADSINQKLKFIVIITVIGIIGGIIAFILNLL